jgi:hypothetical protein
VAFVDLADRLIIHPDLVNDIPKDNISTLEPAFEDMMDVLFTFIDNFFDHLFSEDSISVASSVCDSFGDGDNDEFHGDAVDFVGDVGFDLSMEI